MERPHKGEPRSPGQASCLTGEGGSLDPSITECSRVLRPSTARRATRQCPTHPTVRSKKPGGFQAPRFDKRWLLESSGH